MDDSKFESRNPYGYRGFADRNSLMASFGVAIIVLGCALSSFASLLPAMDNADSAVISQALDYVVSLATKDLLKMNFAGSHALSTVVLIAFVIVGTWLLGRAKRNREAFHEAYPYLEVSFSDAELRRYKLLSRYFMVVGAIVIIAAIVGGVCMHGFINLYIDLDSSNSIDRTRAVENGVFLSLVAIGCWLLIRGKTLRDMPNMDLYNYRALSGRNIYEMDRDSTGSLNSCLLRAREIVAHKILENRVITIIGIIIALALYALPSLDSPYFWIALLAAFIACKIVSWNAYNKVRSIFNVYSQQA